MTWAHAADPGHPLTSCGASCPRASRGGDAPCPCSRARRSTSRWCRARARRRPSWIPRATGSAASVAAGATASVTGSDGAAGPAGVIAATTCVGVIAGATTPAGVSTGATTSTDDGSTSASAGASSTGASTGGASDRRRQRDDRRHRLAGEEPPQTLHQAPFRWRCGGAGDSDRSDVLRRWRRRAPPGEAEARLEAESGGSDPRGSAADWPSRPIWLSGAGSGPPSAGDRGRP